MLQMVGDTASILEAHLRDRDQGKDRMLEQNMSRVDFGDLLSDSAALQRLGDALAFDYRQGEEAQEISFRTQDIQSILDDTWRQLQLARNIHRLQPFVRLDAVEHPEMTSSQVIGFIKSIEAQIAGQRGSFIEARQQHHIGRHVSRAILAKVIALRMQTDIDREAAVLRRLGVPEEQVTAALCAIDLLIDERTDLRQDALTRALDASFRYNRVIGWRDILIEDLGRHEPRLRYPAVPSYPTLHPKTESSRPEYTPSPMNAEAFLENEAALSHIIHELEHAASCCSYEAEFVRIMRNITTLSETNPYIRNLSRLPSVGGIGAREDFHALTGVIEEVIRQIDRLYIHDPKVIYQYLQHWLHMMEVRNDPQYHSMQKVFSIIGPAVLGIYMNGGERAVLSDVLEPFGISYSDLVALRRRNVTDLDGLATQSLRRSIQSGYIETPMLCWLEECRRTLSERLERRRRFLGAGADQLVAA